VLAGRWLQFRILAKMTYNSHMTSLQNRDRSMRRPWTHLAPAKPKLTARLTSAKLPDSNLADDCTLRALAFEKLDLSGRSVEGIEIGRCRMKDTNLNYTILDRSSLVDCIIENCDWASLKTSKSSLIRVEVINSRLTGLVWSSGGLRDVKLISCRADLSSFRFSALTNVVFDECNLRQADFQNADLRQAHFVNCDLTAAQFSHAQMSGIRFSGCILDGVGGVTSFNGVRIDSVDLISLARTLASALGIIIEDA
jgi:uncharacterized protein YjbI with pentapeptide repeats